MAIKSVKLPNSAARLALVIVIAVLSVLAVYTVVNWCLADTLAMQIPTENLKPETVADYTAFAEYAANLSPNDPKTHYSLAALREHTFLADDFQKALGGYEQATSLAPNDFRMWFDLARSLDENGDSERAEKAYRRALELAPNYSRIHWALGNILLRRGSINEAFAEIRQAAANDSTYANPAVGVAWQYYDGNVPVVNEKIGNSIPIRAALSNFLAGQKRFDESFALWNQLSPEDKKETYKADSAALLANLLSVKKFRDALNVYTQIVEISGDKPAVGKITNGGFEADVKIGGNPVFFDWSIADGVQPQIVFDATQKHGGNRSLLMIFNSMNGQDFRAVEQILAVESNARYHFETFARTELETPATFKWEIVDAVDGKLLASTDAVPAKSGDWASLAADFTVPFATEAVKIRLARVPCPVSLCPISGKIWFDDFSLRKS